jgi:uncharacterized coiled-coil protein SlyX
MNNPGERINKLLAEVRKEADELRVQIHLAKLELGDEWVKIESRLEKLEAKAHEVGKTTTEASEDVWKTAKLLGEEIRKGFKSIARHF